jgi:hypothetical protein
VYYTAMPSKTPPISIRFPADFLAKIDAWAERFNCSRHAAVVRLVGIGLGGDAGLAAAYMHEKVAEIEHLAKDSPPAAKVAMSRTVKAVRTMATKQTKRFTGVTALGDAIPPSASRLKKR